jgi:hypothetical protein
MISWITVIAWIQTCRETAAAWLTTFRRSIYPFAAGAGRDMLLLRNEHWVDVSTLVPAEEVVYRYYADKRTICRRGEEGARTKRWNWLSVTYGGVDISDFFQGLRIPDGASVPHNAILMLYAHQQGALPVGKLEVVTRDGMEETVYAFRSRPVDHHNNVEALLNYIR